MLAAAPPVRPPPTSPACHLPGRPPPPRSHRTLVYSELALALLVAAAAIRHARRARSALVGDGARAKAE